MTITKLTESLMCREHRFLSTKSRGRYRPVGLEAKEAGLLQPWSTGRCKKSIKLAITRSSHDRKHYPKKREGWKVKCKYVPPSSFINVRTWMKQLPPCIFTFQRKRHIHTCLVCSNPQRPMNRFVYSLETLCYKLVQVCDPGAQQPEN